MRIIGILGAALIAGHLASGAAAAERLRLAVQKTGTLAWELDTARANDLPRQFGLDLDVTELASPEAGKLALQAGAADIILADIVWVTRQRAAGGATLFAPYTSAPGAVMTRAASPVRTVADLKGLKVGVAGGPLDKSWLLLRAFALKDGLDLMRGAQPAFGAPKLLAVKAEQGELDAVLNYWNICAELEGVGFRRAIDMADVEHGLGARGPVALVGFAFEEKFAATRSDPLARFLMMTAKARALLAADANQWTRLATRIGVASSGALSLYQTRYAEGAMPRAFDEEIADASTIYRAMAAIGGADLVGSARELDPAAYWRAPAEAQR